MSWLIDGRRSIRGLSVVLTGLAASVLDGVSWASTCAVSAPQSAGSTKRPEIKNLRDLLSPGAVALREAYVFGCQSGGFRQLALQMEAHNVARLTGRLGSSGGGGGYLSECS